MSRRFPVLLLLICPLAAAAGDGPKDKGAPTKEPPLTPLEKTLRQLEASIAEVRGLKFKAPIRALIIPRGAVAPGKECFYDAPTRTLYLIDDVKSFDKALLAHEMVHALQDQHFDLVGLYEKLREEKRGPDATLALAALLEGDAVFTKIEALKKEQPKLAALLDTPLDKAKDPDSAFLSTQSARHVKAVKEKGGWAAVDFLYRNPPRTTAPFFHLKSVPTVALGPGTHFGAFGLWKKLHAQPATHDIALKLAQAWRGDRLIEMPAGKAYLFALAQPEDAKLLADAFTRLSGKGADLFLDYRQQIVIDGSRVTILSAIGDKALADLRDRVFGPLRLQVYSAKAERLISYGDFVEELLGADIICIGEYHDEDLHHRVQLHLIKALHARDERLGIGLEMFQSPFQKAIERYFAGKISEAEFLKESEWAGRWGYDWPLYRPIVEFARRNGLPMAALNVSRELTAKISKGGWESLTADERALLGPVDFFVKEHRDWWHERLSKMHGDAKATPERKERSYQVMTAWDDFMGRSAAAFQKAQGVRRMVVLAGLGHIEHGFGIPFRAARLHGSRVATVGIMINPPDVPLTTTGRILLDNRPMTDYVILVREE